ncbi:hypothetical protein OV208_03260 [Corallococcus sp. bb12-1]|uniref:hypothetical protein n=1 Tax=Corallococcus sp. bb12-1 TaxID=2996784 RepID=UPI0022702681|nr:hypothetical protein [Corallococcus sp. bb12-1]MCY1040328.1 hypothetical protein [Corallococcus sp. bb12-1]
MPWHTQVVQLSFLQGVLIVTEAAGMGEFMDERILRAASRTPGILELARTPDDEPVRGLAGTMLEMPSTFRPEGRRRSCAAH